MGGRQRADRLVAAVVRFRGASSGSNPTECARPRPVTTIVPALRVPIPQPIGAATRHQRRGVAGHAGHSRRRSCRCQGRRRRDGRVDRDLRAEPKRASSCRQSAVRSMGPRTPTTTWLLLWATSSTTPTGSSRGASRRTPSTPVAAETEATYHHISYAVRFHPAKQLRKRARSALAAAEAERPSQHAMRAWLRDGEL